MTPQRYAFGGLVSRAARAASKEARDIFERQTRAQALRQAHPGWKMKDLREKAWDTEKIWLDPDTTRTLQSALNPGQRYLIPKFELPTIGMQTNHSAQEEVRKNRVPVRELKSLAANPPRDATPAQMEHLRGVLGGLEKRPFEQGFSGRTWREKQTPNGPELVLDTSVVPPDAASNTVEFPLMQALYPDLMNRVRIAREHPDSELTADGTLGYFDPSNFNIGLAARTPSRVQMETDDPMWAERGTLLHELQHSLQQAHRWNGGANSAFFEWDPVTGKRNSSAEIERLYNNTKGEADARMVQRRDIMRQFELRHPPKPGKSVDDIAPWKIYQEPGVEVDEKDIVHDLKPYMDMFNSKYGPR